MNESLSAYLAYLKRRNGSPTSLRTVNSMLGSFHAFLAGRGRLLSDAAAADLLAYFARKALGPITRYNTKGLLRRYLAFCVEAGYLLVSPWSEALDEKVPPYPLRRVPSRKAVRDELEASSYRPYPARDRALLELGYGTGLRRIELATLRLSDLRGEVLRVRGKGGYAREVPVGKTALRWLRVYLDGERRRVAARSPAPSEALFLSRTGESFTYRGLGHFFSGETALRWHALRHACATHMLEEGANLVVLQKLLGHKDLRTTQIYTQLDTSDLKRMLKKYHPRG